MEYACGLDPLTPDSTSLTDTNPGLPVVAVERTGPDSHLLLSWVQPATDGLMEATVEAGHSLTTFTPVNPEIVSTTTANGYIHRTARLPAPSDGTRLFARVRYTYR